ncbi:MAG TPA: HAD hydrolase-like protein [Candidatus Peribacteria bacterium]|nr:HAD hydrolase-like protein [Candidatus Peribacteria bacterium]
MPQCIEAVRVCMIGEDGLEHALTVRGARIINDRWRGEHGWEETPTHVVSGFTMGLGYQHLAAAHCAIVDHGAQFFVTNPDRSARNHKGISFPANGGTMAFLKHSTGREPIVCGKPEPAMFEEAIRRMDADPRATVVIGDTPETEILGGNRMGLETWMVMGGSTPTLEGIPPEAHPKKQFADIAEITAFLRRLKG